MPDRSRVPRVGPAKRSVLSALMRGARQRCPRCGVGSSMQGYLGIRPACPHCGEKLGHIRADDGPAYFTVLISGHVVVSAVLLAEQAWHPPFWPMLAVAMVGMWGTDLAAVAARQRRGTGPDVGAGS